MTYFDAADPLQLTLDLLAIRGESKNERQIADFVKSYLKKLGLHPIEDDADKQINGNAGNISCEVVSNSSSSSYYFVNAHLDTVVPTHEADITVQNNKIYTTNNLPAGIDNRAGIGIILSALTAIKKQKIPHENFHVVFTVAEDAGLLGSPHFKIPAEVKTGYCFDASPRPGTFIASGSGSYEFTVEITGKKAHGGVAPEKGINAIQIASHAISKLQLGWLNEYTTVNLGIIHGGNATNVVPDNVVLKGELRSKTIEEIRAHLNRIEIIFKNEAKRFGGAARVQSKMNFAPYTHSENLPAYKKLEDAISRTGLQPRPIHYAGGSDANVFNSKGLTTLNLGIGAQNPHSPDEFILIEDLVKSTEIAIELLRR